MDGMLGGENIEGKKIHRGSRGEGFNDQDKVLPKGSTRAKGGGIGGAGLVDFDLVLEHIVHTNTSIQPPQPRQNTGTRKGFKGNNSI